jgi:hypothetical protein
MHTIEKGGRQAKNRSITNKVEIKHIKNGRKYYKFGIE